MNAAPSERERYWQAADDALGDFLRRNPSHPRRFLLQMQEALVVLARGELARQEAEVGADSEQKLAEAREQIREAARRLEALERELEREIPLRAASRGGGEELSSAELSSLLDHVRHQLARTYRNQALSYPPGSADRVSALSQAVNRLTSLRRSIGETGPLAWSSGLELATCLRLLEKPAEAAELLQSLQSQNPPPAIALEIRAEHTRLAIARDRADEALETISVGRTLHGETSAELDFAHLETYIALWKRAEAEEAPEQAADWRKKAAAMTRLIEESHGPYWRRRAETLLTGAASGSAAAGDLEILVRTARDHYLRRRLDEAVAAYDAAARQAEAAGDAKQAFELLYKAAAVEHERQKHSEAARRFREVATRMPQQPIAGQAHLLACFNLAQVARADRERLDDYAAALEEHIQYWPSEADQARLWLGKLRESQQRWDEAAAAYRGVAPAHAEFEAAVAGAARSWLRRLAELDAGAERQQEAEEAARFFEQIVTEFRNGILENIAPAAREAALAAARVRLHYIPAGHADAERVLRTAVEAASDHAPGAWRSEATGLLAVALAGQTQRAGEALTLLRVAAGNSPQQLWEIAQSLASLTAEAPEHARPQLARLTLEALDRLEPDLRRLSAAEQLAAARLRAESLVAAGRAGEARKLYESLASQHPHDSRIQEGYGELLLAANDPADREAALRQWRIIAQRARPRSELWWRAKHNVAQLHLKSGDREQAAQLIRYLQAIPPGLDDSPLKQELLDLLRRAEGQ
jgi:TolA-binding protein